MPAGVFDQPGGVGNGWERPVGKKLFSILGPVSRNLLMLLSICAHVRSARRGSLKGSQSFLIAFAATMEPTFQRVFLEICLRRRSAHGGLGAKRLAILSKGAMSNLARDIAAPAPNLGRENPGRGFMAVCFACARLPWSPCTCQVGFAGFAGSPLMNPIRGLTRGRACRMS